MADTKSLEDSLTCPICLDISSYENPVETSCCHQLFCSSCIQNVSPCPACRAADFQTVPAHFARRLIGGLKTSCPNVGCTKTLNRSDLAKHLSTQCRNRPLKCPDPECQGFQCPKKSFAEHLLSKHRDFLTENFEKMWNSEAITGRVTVTQEETRKPIVVRAAAGSTAGEDRDEDFDCIIEARNDFGRRARLGASGKYYCKGRLDGPRCTCCNGYCGPSNGCNCSACMILDVKKRKLPRGWLVNHEGGSARCSTETPDVFYCGRMVMRDNPRTDGYCGPTNGEQCIACRRLNEQHFGRYRRVWSDRS